MDYEKKTKGLAMFRLVAGRAISKKTYASFSHKELLDIMKELDEKVPRKNPHMVPKYYRDENNKPKHQA